MEQREQIIRHYIEAYNSFDVERMLENLTENVQFENITGGEATHSIMGLSAFRKQAEKAKAFFSERLQTIRGFLHYDNQT